MRVPFFRVAERKEPKKGRPYCARPFAALRATCDARTEGAPQNSLRADALRSNNCGKSVHEVRVSFGTRTHPLPCASRHAQKGPPNGHPHGPLLRFAALGPVSRAQAPRAAQAGPSAAMARVAVLPPLPLWMRRGAQGFADQGSRLSERSETERVRARPRQTRAPQVAPARSGGDADSGVALSLVPFFRRRERKGLACRATPGLRLHQRHTVRFIHKLQQPQPSIPGGRRSAVKNVAAKA